MKLYTEEQIKNAYTQIWADGGHDKYSLSGLEEMLEQLTPIELPSDEEIREERLLQFLDTEYTNRANDRLAFYCGAKFVINKIQGSNK